MREVSLLATLGLGGPAGALLGAGFGGPGAAPPSWRTLNSTRGTTKNSWTLSKWQHPELEEYIENSVYTIKAILIDVNGKEALYPISNTIRRGFYGKKPLVKVEFKWVKAIKASLGNILINTVQILRGKEIKNGQHE